MPLSWTRAATRCATPQQVFSHMDGAVDTAPLSPPVYQCEDDLARVREVLHHILGS